MGNRPNVHVERSSACGFVGGNKHPPPLNMTKPQSSLVMSTFIPSQLATTAGGLLDCNQWLYEPKFDGYRAQLILHPDGPRLFTRGGLDWSDRFRSAVPCAVPPALHGIVIDAEICVLDETGRPDFAKLCRNLSSPSSPFVIFCFDLLALAAGPITAKPLLERKALLEPLVAALACDHIRFVPHTRDGSGLAAELQAAKWEGLMIKDGSAPYLPGQRASSWRKFKFLMRDEFPVVAWRPDPISGALRSILLARPDTDGLHACGSIGSGFTATERRQLPKSLAALSAPHSLLATGTPAGTSALHWLRPTLLAEIEFLEFSSHGCVRGARFLGLREDKWHSEAGVLEDAALDQVTVTRQLGHPLTEPSPFSTETTK